MRCAVCSSRICAVDDGELPMPALLLSAPWNSVPLELPGRRRCRVGCHAGCICAGLSRWVVAWTGQGTDKAQCCQGSDGTRTPVAFKFAAAAFHPLHIPSLFITPTESPSCPLFTGLRSYFVFHSPSIPLRSSISTVIPDNHSPYEESISSTLRNLTASRFSHSLQTHAQSSYP